MSVTRTVPLALCLAIVAACGSSPKAATGIKPKTFEAALGIDQASMNAREAKVQEAVRACMKAEGFDYIPVDPSQGGPKVAFAGGPGFGSDDPNFRRTNGYGITTGIGAGGPAKQGGSDTDPNSKIRDGLSDADKKAYDRALFGSAAEQMTDKGGSGFSIHVEAGAPGDKRSTGAPTDDGCFGTAQRKVRGGPESLGPSLKELEQRISGDPRLIQADQRWASCMSKAGYGQFEKPDDIVKYLVDKLQKLSGAPPSTDGSTTFAIGGADVDQAGLARLRQEELTIARTDDGCARSTGQDKVAKQVRTEAQQKFIDDHPDLTAGK